MNHRKRCSAGSIFVVISILILSCNETPYNETDPIFFTSDIDLFWQVFDSNKPDFKKEVFKNDYVRQGSKGLKDYDKLKDICPKLEITLQHPDYLEYYQSIRDTTRHLHAEISIIREAYKRFGNVYQGFYPADVYFLIGSLSAGGKRTRNGLLIAVEFFTKSDDSIASKLDGWYREILRTKEYIPSIVMHESVHFQQTFYPHNSAYFTLLEQSIIEGMADYVSVQILAGTPFFNQHLHDYADTLEYQIWSDFAEEMHKNYSDVNGWLYNAGDNSRTRPADLGYYVGYKIVEAYALLFPTIEEAIESMLTVSDYTQIFELSNYENTFQ